MNFGKKLQLLLNKKNITQADLARKIGQKTPAVARWVTGKYKPSTKNIYKIAKALDVSTEELLTENRKEDVDEIKQIKEEIKSLRNDFNIMKNEIINEIRTLRIN